MTEAPQSGRAWGRLTLSLLVGGATLAYVFSQLHWATFARALADIRALEFLLFIGSSTLAMLAADAWATAHVYRRSVGPTSWRDVLILRGASYLPSLVNYHLGQALFTYFLSRRHQVPVWRVAGATLLTYATTLAGLFVLAGISLLLAPGQFPWLSPVLASAIAAGVGYLVALRFGGRWLGRWEATRVLSEAGWSGHLVTLTTRLPHIVVLYLGMWLPFFFFDVSIPFEDSLVVIPILLLIGAFPLTPQGVGPREVVALELLAAYAPGSPEEAAARIAACSLSWAVSMTLWEAVVAVVLAGPMRALVKR